MNTKYLLFVLLQLLVHVQSIPSLTKCSLEDSTCLTTQARVAVKSLLDGIPELGIERLDPMELDETGLQTDDGLRYKTRNMIAYGLKNSTIDKVSVNSRLKLITIIFKTDLHVESDYELSGSFMFVPAFGKGKAYVDTGIVRFNFIIVYDIVKNNGKSYIQFKNHYYGVLVTGSMVYDYKNLYNGDNVKGDKFVGFLNENSLITSYQFTRGYYDKIVSKIVDSIKIYMSANALEDIALY